jgi:hypothetical protein
MSQGTSHATRGGCLTDLGVLAFERARQAKPPAPPSVIKRLVTRWGAVRLPLAGTTAESPIRLSTHKETRGHTVPSGIAFRSCCSFTAGVRFPAKSIGLSLRSQIVRLSWVHRVGLSPFGPVSRHSISKSAMSWGRFEIHEMRRRISGPTPHETRLSCAKYSDVKERLEGCR